MTNTKHTPAPWHVINEECLVITDNFGQELFEYTAEGKDEFITEAEANARLIAAAPELLEALESISDWILDNVPT